MLFDNYRKIDWRSVLCNAQSIDMVVTYFDSWVKAYWEDIIDFYKRGGQIRVVLTDPKTEAINIAWKRFPKYDFAEFIRHVEHTVIYFQDALHDSKSEEGRFETYLFDQALNYAVIRVDNKQLFLSFYEHCSRTRVGAPSIFVDLEAFPCVKEYWSQEFRALFDKSTRFDARGSTLK